MLNAVPVSEPARCDDENSFALASDRTRCRHSGAGRRHLSNVVVGGAAKAVHGRRVNRQITQSVEQLSEAAIAMGHGAPIDLDRGPNSDEIDTVTKTLRWAYETIHARALEQERAREDAVEANRAKDQFIATLAHEVRTPLSAIAAATESLERTAARRETGIIKRQVTH
jgi:signal transduction histidine kinase